MTKPEPKPTKPPVEPEVPLPLPVLVAAEQPPIPVVLTAPDGVTPVPIPALGIEANTPPATTPVVVPGGVGPGEPAQATTTTTSTTVPTPVMPPTVTKLEGVTLPPTTTEEQDITTKGQRRVSLLWESIQGFISVVITLAVIYCQVKGINSETLNNAFFFVVATYLQRTNHIRVGGVGVKPYEGR